MDWECTMQLRVTHIPPPHPLSCPEAVYTVWYRGIKSGHIPQSPRVLNYEGLFSHCEPSLSSQLVWMLWETALSGELPDVLFHQVGTFFTLPGICLLQQSDKRLAKSNWKVKTWSAVLNYTPVYLHFSRWQHPKKSNKKKATLQWWIKKEWWMKSWTSHVSRDGSHRTSQQD